MARIIHAADIHLDSPLQGLGRLGDAGLADELRAATRRAYDNLVQLCISEDADLLVIAGDIYDGDWRSYETGEYFVRGLRTLRESGVEVALLYGNHDAESTITRRLTMPDGVRVLNTAEPESAGFPDLGVVVHGQGYAVRDVMENLAQNYPSRRDGWVNIGVLHTGLHGIAGHTPYAPCTINELTACGYEYFALGHIHQREQQAGGNTHVWYSGNLQGRKSTETGPKGALVVDAQPDMPAEVRFAECDVARWEVLEPDLAECRDVDEVVSAMSLAYEDAVGQAGDRPLVVRFRLVGQTAAASALSRDPDRLLTEARLFVRRGNAVEKVVLDVSPPASAPTYDSELAATVARATEQLTSDLKTIRENLGGLRGQRIWQLTKDTDIDLNDDAAMASLAERAGRRLVARLEA
ncbi:SbcD DNA repair exonuclease [Mycobacteriaceae bacterium]